MLYFNHAATSFPKPESVYRKMDIFYREVGLTPGRSGHAKALEAAAEISRTRKKISDFFHAPKPEQVVFSFNATDALNIAVHGILSSGDEVVTTVMEHNSVSRPIRHAARELGLKVTWLEPVNGVIRPEDVRSALNKKTRLVAVTHASNVTGQIQPIDEIGKTVGEHSSAAFLVDAAQTAGLLPIDVMKNRIGLLAFTGHKSLYGPTGIGGLIVSPEFSLRPFRTGGSGVNSEEDYQPDEMPYRLEAGTENLIGIAGLSAALDFILGTGMQKIRSHDLGLKTLLLEGLKNIKGINIFTPEGESALNVVSFTVKDLPPSEAAAILESEFDIALRAGLHCAPGMHRHLGTFPEGTVRLSTGFFNTEEEVRSVVSAVEEVVKSIW